MPLNKMILMKFKEKTENEPEFAAFFQSILEFESGSKEGGWYKKEYEQILENACKEVQKNET